MGPLTGLKIIEFAGLGPAPYCCMLLADLGAEVITIDRKAPGWQPGGAGGGNRFNVWNRGRKSVAIDLKAPGAIKTCLKLIEAADALVEGFRPGVMERLGLGPELCLAANPKLVYGRMTGWGQTGPLSNAAGHDINYIALTGALHAIGRAGEKPVPPLNLVGDFGGGSLFLAFGLVAALLEAKNSGKGQVVDAAMTDGAASLMAMSYGLRAAGMMNDTRGTNLLDGGAPFYDTYETADGKWVAIGALEPQFYALLREKAGLTDAVWDQQMETKNWPALKEKLGDVFKSKTRDVWCALMEGTDVCFAPVLSMEEAPHHPHNVARGAFSDLEGVIQPAPAPRFSRTPGAVQGPPPETGADTEQVLTAWGLAPDDIQTLKEKQAI